MVDPNKHFKPYPVETELRNRVMEAVNLCRNRITIAQVLGIFKLVADELMDEHRQDL